MSSNQNSYGGMCGMKLIKEIKVTYRDEISNNRSYDMDAFFEDIRARQDSTTYFFEVSENENYVYFAAYGGYDWEPIDEGDSLPDTVQVETAIYVKATNEVVFFADTEGLSDPTRLNGIPYWTRKELELVGALEFRDCGNNEFGDALAWYDFV